MTRHYCLPPAHMSCPCFRTRARERLGWMTSGRRYANSLRRYRSLCLASEDFFDKPATCERLWDWLLSGMVFDALVATKDGQSASTADVERLLADDFAWQPARAVGEGSEWRAESRSV